MDKIQTLLSELLQAISELKPVTENGTGVQLTERKPVVENGTDVWFDLAGLCGYLPDRPAKQTVYLWVHKRQIPYYKTGKKLRFLKKDVDAWLKNGRRKTQTEIEQEAETYLRGKKKGGMQL